VSETTKQH